MHRRLGRLLLAMAACWLTACAARGATPQHPEAGASCVASTAARTRREMTWAEYYTDVARQAQRNRAMIIWVNPPDVRVAACR
jgi:hypothetical protein